MSAELQSLPVCNATGTAGAAAGGGVMMCSGTSGACEGVPSSTATIPNNEPLAARQYVNAFCQTTSTLVDGTASTANVNPCLSQGVPTGSDLTPGAANPTWNQTPFTTFTGCCASAGDWNVSTEINASRRTRLTPFTTASAVGADDGGNMTAFSASVGSMTKFWGGSPTSWMHGGVSASNTGMWSASEDNNNTAFTVKYNGKTWVQDAMLWCRMTGDNYSADKDPFGVKYPAGAGTFNALPTVLKTYGVDADGPKADCSGCSVASGEVVSNGGGSCETPMLQFCTNMPLTADIMQQPTGTVKGFTKAAQTYANTTNPNTGAVNGYSDPISRVGGCFTTRDMYGPGKFSILVNLPPTAPAASTDAITQPEFPSVDPYTGVYPSSAATAVKGGRGYVFSMWTFGYTEAYAPAPSDPAPYNMSQVPGISSESEQQNVQSGIVNGNMTRPMLNNIVSGDANDGYYATHNHEIDIEIPSNTSQTQGTDMTKYLGLDTANFNTWLTDTDEYSAGSKPLYQQAQAKLPSGQYFASVGPDDTNETFQELSFVWYVDPTEEMLDISTPAPPAPTSIDVCSATGSTSPPEPQTRSYVAFYRNGVELYRSHRFVPRRSGRVIFGLWPAWWGSNYNPLTFNHVYAKIARVEFVPQCDINNTPFTGGALVTNAAQMYDQMFPKSTGMAPSYSATEIVPGLTPYEIFCGFEETPLAPASAYGPVGGGGGPAKGPAKAPAKAPAKGPAAGGLTPGGGGGNGGRLPVWAIVLIVVLAVLVVGGGVAAGVIFSKKKGGMRRV